MAEIQARLQALSDDFTKLQKDLQETVASKQRLEAQKRENMSVQQVFSNLREDEHVYKLVGPVLLKQERSDAESTVNGRLEFIGKEIARLEDQIKDTQKQMEDKKAEIIQLQAGPQAAMLGASKA